MKGDPDLTRAPASDAGRAEVIDGYRLLQPLGEGGMGEVWLAEQERPIRRRVALKVIKAGMDSRLVVTRFEAERQALALMNHPAVAKVFDGGTTREGRPYFVMEYVKGESITAYCDRQRLTIRERVDLFIQVCEGVQHAHQKGVIHRDLKPSNILVELQDDRPVPKIIDFGVAKAVTQSLTDRTLFTEVGALIGTPEYMSPEQADLTAADIDTRTDVYALGVILYELMTGLLPFDSRTLRDSGPDSMRRTIREVDPPRPSTRLTKGADATVSDNRRTDLSRLAGELRGDLDWIVMKAIEKERTRRYPSAVDLAADLRRHLEDQPVVAGPPSARYRATKFVRRHRVGVTVAAGFVVLLLAFAVTVAVQATRIARERDRANLEAAAARQVSDFMIGLFNVSNPSEARGNSLTAREILDAGARQVDLKLQSQPLLQARLEQTIGTVYTSLGLYASAEAPLQKAVAALRRTSGDSDPATLSALNALANVYWYQDRYADAEPIYLAVVQGRRGALGENHRDTLHAQFDLASLYIQRERWAEAEPLARTTLDAQRRLFGDADSDTLDSLNNLGSLYYRQRRYADALPVYEKALEISGRVHGQDHPDTIQGMHNLASTYDGLGRYDDAQSLYLKTVTARRRVLGAAHPDTLRTTSMLAALYQRQHRYADAESQLIAAYRALMTTPDTEPQRSGRLANQLVSLYDAWGQPAKAAEWRAKMPATSPASR